VLPSTGLRRSADIVLQIQHDGRLHLITGVQVAIRHDRAGIQWIRRIEGLERRGRHVVMTVRGGIVAG